MKVTGNIQGEDGKALTENVELWLRNPLECIRELIGNPVFQAYLKYAPEKLFGKSDSSERIFGEMWTADWWWETQVSMDLVRSLRGAAVLTFG